MTTIKLNHPAVTKQVDQVKTALGTVTLGNLPAGELGNNKLEFTSKWIDRENEPGEGLRAIYQNRPEKCGRYPCQH
ncbi:DUF5344 family protein [Peribacillus frigoritolerans]|nr:DUF5344 family protein [Peribacillus frigoritolerans]